MALADSVLCFVDTDVVDLLDTLEAILISLANDSDATASVNKV